MKTIEFCCGKRRCPVISVEGDTVVLGGENEGYTVWTKDNLRDFVETARSGKFDELVGE